MQLKRITICVALAFAPNAFAAETTLPSVEVIGKKIQPLPALSDSALSGTDLVRLRASTNDTAKLLDGQPGVSIYGSGGVSSLPAIHGMADDRVRVKVDGMDLISACANHMNPPLSYIDPANVGSIKVFAGITPVSVGGDSIGGTIQVDSAAPEFAQAGQGTLLKGQAGAFYRSNGNAQGGNFSAAIAGETLRFSYTSSTVRAGNYKAAKDFKTAGTSTGTLTTSWVAGNEVASSLYQSENQAVAVALRHENHLVELKLGYQHIPYQGFPNEWMDMTGNNSQQINLRYRGQYQWGALEARAYNENTRHKMNDLAAKRSSVAGMPMDTDAKNTGLLAKADVVLSDRDILRMGTEYQRYRLNDWWDPASAAVGMMGSGTYWNINNGQRDRFDIFGEWEARWNPQWISQIGLRSDTTTMNVGNAQGYNTSAMAMNGNYGVDAPAFNALKGQRTDHNIDLTALARYTPDAGKTFEAGYAQKTRSPNLYERFAWSKSGMAMRMISWFGDANGYVGAPNLKPEVAHTVSGTAGWHDAAQEEWELKVTPYYTHIHNYIDAVPVACTMCTTTGAVFLQFANQTARIYGADISGRMPLAKSSGYGSFSASGVLNYLSGKNLTTGDNLYNMMPLNAKLAVDQRWGNWSNTVEAQLVDTKKNVSLTRREDKTGGYGLVNLRSSYEWKQLRFDVGVENIFNKFYAHPLAGSYIGQKPQNAAGTSVPGMGRSVYTGMTLKF